MDITVFLMPMRIEYLDYFREFSRDFDIIIPELVDSDGVMKFLSGAGSLDDALMDIEIQDYEFSRIFLQILRDLSAGGKYVIPVDPYGKYSMTIRMMHLTNKLSIDALSNEEKYVAYMEVSIANIMRKYSLALSISNFDELVSLTIKYAKANSGRIRFRSELRARAISKLLIEGDYIHRDVRVLVHSDYFNAIITQYLSEKLGVNVNVESAAKGLSRRLGLPLMEQPGYLLTMNHVNNKPMSTGEERLLAARTVAYVSLRPRIARLGLSTNPYVMALMDNSLISILNTMDYDKCRSLFYKVRPNGPFKIRI